LEELRRMPEAARRELVEAIDLEFGLHNDEPTADQIAEFERRGEELRRNPANGIPWEQVRAELKPRSKARSWDAR
jgi:putative addiction module component (TIGR02574 family)